MSKDGGGTSQISCQGDCSPGCQVESSKRERERSVRQPDTVAGGAEDELLVSSRARSRVRHPKVGAVFDRPTAIKKAPSEIRFLEAVVEGGTQPPNAVERGTADYRRTSGKAGRRS